MGRSREARKIRVWDPALRFYHWTLALLVVVNWLLGQFGPNVMTLHFSLGYAILALLVFRIIWGFVGPAPARFGTFLRGPSAVAGYLRHVLDRSPSHWFGHNPLGALSVIAMLLALIWQVGTGLISDPEDFVNVGQLAGDVPGWLSRKAVGWHSLGGSIVLILLFLHVAMILFYRLWKNEDLVRPMITGWKWVRMR